MVAKDGDGSKLLPVEKKAALSLSLIYGVRMLGLFIILPVFSLIASDYQHSTPVLIGLAMGIYGLFQALLQIPFGMLSDKIGRKPVIVAGLALFVLGSIVAAHSDSIYGVIVGRALQGAGAISAALIALAADLTRDHQRTKMMAILGSSIGAAFLVSLVLGPLLAKWFALSGLFWFTGICGLLAIVLVWKMVPTPTGIKVSGDTVASLTLIPSLVRDRQLLRLDLGIFCLHLIVTAMFVGVPLVLAGNDFPLEDHWRFYVPALLLSILVMVPAIIIAERYRKLRSVFLLAIAGIGVSQLVLIQGLNQWPMVLFGIFIFFSFFNTLEALLPSLVSRLAPPGVKGTAMGIYSTSQFAGAFVGGAGGGWIFSRLGLTGLFASLSLLCILWLILAWGLKAPKPVSTYIHTLGSLSDEQRRVWVEDSLKIQGVEDVVVVVEEKVAYLKVIKSQFDPALLPVAQDG